ncbi:MAG: ATP-binding cassette domain-containing protein [bacterium]|nr:ATP-binding cassette domain-containing protein [bacterium]
MEIIQAINIVKAFGKKIVLADVSLNLEKGKLYGLIGPSGSGKSVLLKTLAGIYEPELGSVKRSGSSMSLMFQEGALFDSMSILDNVAFSLVSGRVPVQNLSKDEKEMVTKKVGYILHRVGLGQAAHKLPSQISGGMRKRASLARALVAKPDIVFLDDPTSGLDPVSSNVIMNLISELHSEYNPTMIIVSHDLRRLLPKVEHIISMWDGQIIFQGDLSNLKKTNDSTLRHFVSCRFDLGAQA